ncbi:RICIN domain-containing protein [Streptomyces sp. NPDC046876]|uniref:RICIN domain-containing protein n=1 Tax=Streptomyces sp. NPDC046876 TaxID=3155616 RepID=UPI0034114254
MTGLAGKCLDVEGGSTADGTRVQLWSCKDVKAQKWRLTDNTVRALGKCLTADNGQARIAACDGSDKQKFVYRPGDKTLYNQAANACVDVPGGNTADGTDLLVYACNGGTNQQWAFDNTTTYIYDASGNRLIEETGSSRTPYLGEAEVTVNKAGQAVDAIRYYSGPGGVTTRRTDGKATGHKLDFLLSDHHSTATASVNQAAGQQITLRKFDPYGNVRGAVAGNWTGDRTFLGTDARRLSYSTDTHRRRSTAQATTWLCGKARGWRMTRPLAGSSATCTTAISTARSRSLRPNA